MTRLLRNHSYPDGRRIRIVCAVITGAIAGAARAILDTLLHYMATGY